MSKGWERFRSFAFEPAQRLAFARAVAAMMMAAQLLLNRSLFLDRALPAAPPTLPLFRWLPSLPEPGGLILWGVMVAACGLVVIGRWSRRAAIVVAAGYALMVILDQARWQAHFIVGPVMLLLTTLRAPTPRDSLGAVRLALASVYFFAGLGKLNIVYVTLVHTRMMQPVIDRVPGFIGHLVAFPWFVPIAEMTIGIATFSPGAWRTRRFVLAAALFMHAFIIVTLLLGEGDLAVVPFNLGIALLVLAVLLDDADLVARPRLRPMLGTMAGRLAIAYAVVVPVLSIIGVADMYLAHAYYAGSEGRIRWFVSQAAAERLASVPWPEGALVDGHLQPARLPPGWRPVGDGHMFFVPYHPFMNVAFAQGVMGEARIADRVKDRLCEYAAREPNDVIVRYTGVASSITGDRNYRDANCDESLGFWLRFGGFHTIVLGGDEPVYVFEQHGKPTF